MVSKLSMSEKWNLIVMLMQEICLTCFSISFFRRRVFFFSFDQAERNETFMNNLKLKY